jgi:hypothetical protein
MKSRAIFEKMSKISQEAEKTQITNVKNESIHLIVVLQVFKNVNELEPKIQ